MHPVRGVADPSTESLVDLANFCCRCLNIPTLIKNADEVDASYLVMVYKRLYGMDDDSKDPFYSLDDVSDRIRYIRDELGSVLEEDLDHIKVDSLIRGDTTAVFYLMEIIAAIVALWVFPKLDFMNDDFCVHSDPPPLVCSPEMPRSSTRACLPHPSATGESVLRTKAQASSSYGDYHKVDDRSSGSSNQCVDGGYQVWPSEVANLLAASPPATPREKDHVEIVPSSCSPKPVTPPSPMHLCMLQSTDSGLRSSPRGDDSSSDLEEKGKMPSPQTTKNETAGPSPTETGGGATSGIASLKSSVRSPDNKVDDPGAGDLTGRSCTSLHTTSAPPREQQEPPSGYVSEDDDDRHRRSGTDSTRANALQPPVPSMMGCAANKTGRHVDQGEVVAELSGLSSCASDNTSRTTAPSSFSFGGPSEGITMETRHYSMTLSGFSHGEDIDAGASAATCPSSVSGISSAESCSYRDEVFWAADQAASSTAAHSTRAWSHDVSNIRRNAKRVHRRAIAVDDLARSLSSFAQDMCYRQRGLAKRSRQLAQFRACLADLRDSLTATTSQIDMLLKGSHDDEDSIAAGETVVSFGRLHAPHLSLNRPRCVGFAPRVSSAFSEIEIEKRRLDRECESLFYAKQRCTADFFDLMLRKLKGCSPTLPTPIA